MSDPILACRIEGREIYFIKRPEPGQHSGLLRDESGDIPIDFWSYVSRFSDIEVIDDSEYLKDMWFGDTQTIKWQKEYLYHGENVQNS